ncbi:MAG: stage II sporulation protein M [Candidatus Hydrothermarchaeales archaeon]
MAIFFGFIFTWTMASSSSIGKVILALDVVSKVLPLRSQVLQIFFKNSLASLATIFLGVFLCYLELRVYVGVAPNTYAFLESLTEPLYRVLGAFFPVFSKLRPFFRSCFLYLYFVPYLAITVNGLAFGFLLERYILGGMFSTFVAMISPHGFIEVPAMLFSAYLGLLIADNFKSSIYNAELKGLRNQIEETIRRGILIPALVIQVMLLVAAFLEVNYLFSFS